MSRHRSRWGLRCYRGAIRRGCHRYRWARRRSHPGSILGLLALEDGLQRIARLGHMRQIKLGLGLHRRHARRGTARSAAEVATHLLGFILFDGARMRLLLGDANRRQSIQNGFALDF
jgi:hypothetical protein